MDQPIHVSTYTCWHTLQCSKMQKNHKNPTFPLYHLSWKNVCQLVGVEEIAVAYDLRIHTFVNKAFNGFNALINSKRLGALDSKPRTSWQSSHYNTCLINLRAGTLCNTGVTILGRSGATVTWLRRYSVSTFYSIVI